MKVFAFKSKKISFIDEGTRTGQIKIKCPLCSDERRNKRDRSLSWNTNLETGTCHHCNETFAKYRELEKKEEYVKVQWSNKTNLSDKAVKWFENERKISQRTLSAMGVCSRTEYMPQIGKKTSVIAFPFKKKGEVVNVKFRDGAKNFKMVTGAEKVLYNQDCIKEAEYLIITEGEIDALTFIEIGMDKAVSVPNGASTNTEYLDDVIEDISKIEKVYIATDNDSKGLALRDELCRRIGFERSYIVDFKDSKDANECYTKHGSIELRKVINESSMLKMDGVFLVEDISDKIDDLWLNGLQKGKEIGSEKHDELITFETRRLAVVTGIPGHGKSEYVDWVVSKLNVLHGWKAAYFSPENFPVNYHFAKIAEKFIGKKFERGVTNTLEKDLVKSYINKNFQFIIPKDDWGLDNIIAKAKYCVKMYGSKIFVIDAYNKLEHKIPAGVTETNYVSKMLDDMLRFAHTYNCLFILVAHPRKMQKDANGKHEVPNMYSISGSANFYNKTDYGISVYRESDDKGGLGLFSSVYIQKVKFRHLGSTGVVDFAYNINNGRFQERPFEDAPPSNWDNSNWLNSKPKKINFHQENPFE